MLKSTERKIQILTKDGIALSSLILLPEHGHIKGVVQFHAGTVVKKEYYQKFGRYIADQGYAVVLFDYRGVGESKPNSLRGFKASILDWGIHDATAVLDYIQKEFPNLPIHMVAHSMGGQIIGLMHNWQLLDKILVLASSSGNWHNFQPRYRKKVKWSTTFTFPIMLPLLGYVPGYFGLGADWPKGVALDWWSNSRSNGLMAHHLSAQLDKSFYKEIDTRIDAWFFTDDHMATDLTVPNFQKSYPAADVRTKVISPESVGLVRIGHFGIFKEFTKDVLWSDVIQLLQA